MMFHDDGSDEIRDRIFTEFNSLSVAYSLPSASFVRQGATQDSGVPESSHGISVTGMHSDMEPARMPERVDVTADLLGTEGPGPGASDAPLLGGDTGPSDTIADVRPGAPPSGSGVGPSQGALDLNDLLGVGGGTASQGFGNDSMGVGVGGGGGVTLQAGSPIDERRFEDVWARSAAGETSVEVAVDPVATVAVAVEPEKVRRCSWPAA